MINTISAIPTRIICDKKISSGAVRTYALIIALMNMQEEINGNKCAKILNITARTFYRHIKELRKGHYLIVEHITKDTWQYSTPTETLLINLDYEND